MNEMINFKGHFKIQAIDAFNNVVDEWEEHNMIMDSARYTMAKIFANIDYSATSTTKPFVDTVILGTLGNIDGDILTPKAAAEGFVKERTRLFSESINVGDSSIINIKQNDLIKYTGTGNLNGITGNYYIYLPTSDASINPLTTDFTDTNLWKNYGADKPYTYSVGFELPRTTDDACSNIVEEDAGSSVSVSQTDTSLTFTFSIATTAANGDVNLVPFTEAAIYANGDIFAMKTFKAKIKDNSVLLKIIWTITF